MERVLRSVFVQRAEQLLSRGRTARKTASDVRIGLMIGVHRNVVRHIKTTKTKVQLEKVRHRHRGAALLQAWATDWRFLNAAGQPRDLPLRGFDDEPSFEMLVGRTMAGVSFRTALAELRRSGAIRLLPDEYVRLLSQSIKPAGINQSSVGRVAQRLEQLTSTLLHNLRAPDQQQFCEDIDEVRIDTQRLAAVRGVIARRSRVFLDSLSAELRGEAVNSTNRSRDVSTIGLTLYGYEKAR
jgi:hypothetical protein